MKNIMLLFFTFGLSISVAHGVTKVYVYNMPPYVMEEGKTGIAIDILKEMFKLAKEKVVIEFAPLIRSLANVKTEPESCIAPIQRTQEREYNHFWVGPIIVASSSVFTKLNFKTAH